MQDWIITIIIGLLLLTLLEFTLLLIIAAAKCGKEPQQKPRLVIPEHTRPERYEWEDALDALNASKPEPQPPPKSSGRGAITVIIALLIIAVLLSVALTFGSIPTDLSFLPEYAANAMLLQENAIEDLLNPEKPYLRTIGISSFAMLLALTAFIYSVERKRARIVHKAKSTADKLIKKAEKTAAEKQKNAQTGGIGQYAFPLLLLACLLLIGLVLYLFRDQITAELPALAKQGYAQTAVNFLDKYKYYVIGGAIALIIEIIVILKITSGKRQDD